jgi:hypothetical protein
VVVWKISNREMEESDGDSSTQRVTGSDTAEGMEERAIRVMPIVTTLSFGHGKGPWDGLGAMTKSKVTVDIMHGKERTSTGQITSAMLVAQHLQAIFCNKDWDMEHADMKIQQVVVLYLHNHQISRPPAPPIVSPCKGIMSCFSFMFLGVPRHYARRSFSCWCTACSRVRGRGH